MSILGDPVPGATPIEAVKPVTQERVQAPKSEVPLPSSGVDTIGLLRTITERGGYLLDSTRQQQERDLQREAPSKPDNFLYELLVNAGQPEEKAREIAMQSAQQTYLDRKANAQAALDYLRILNTPGANFESIAFLSEAIATYNRQFIEMGRLLRIDLAQLSQLDPNLTIEQVYRRNLTPIPERLTGVFFDENTQATVKYRPVWDSKEERWGSFFPFSAEYGEDGTVLRVKHDSDHSKIHEDSHFLVAAIKGEKGYYGDYQLAMVGEGFAPIFELWFAGSLREGQTILTENALNLLNRGGAPVELRDSTSDLTDPEWWEKAKYQMVIREHTGTTRISAEIMRLIQGNPDVTFTQLFKSFLEAGTLEEFFQKIEATGAVKKGLDEFKKGVTHFSGMARESMK
jgi:hypothetical protein